MSIEPGSGNAAGRRRKQTVNYFSFIMEDPSRIARKGDLLTLVRVNAAFAQRAVRALTGGRQVGLLPKAEADRIASDLDDGCKYKGHVTNTLESRTGVGQSIGVAISTYVADSDIEGTAHAEVERLGCSSCFGFGVGIAAICLSFLWLVALTR